MITFATDIMRPLVTSETNSAPSASDQERTEFIQREIMENEIRGSRISKACDQRSCRITAACDQRSCRISAA